MVVLSVWALLLAKLSAAVAVETSEEQNAHALAERDRLDPHQCPLRRRARYPAASGHLSLPRAQIARELATALVRLQCLSQHQTR